MSTSGTVSFSATLNDIARHALLKVNGVAAGVAMSAQSLADAKFALNAMVKRWSVQGIKVWTVREATLFPVASQAKYTFGHATAANNSHATDDYDETEVAVAASSGASTITVDSDDEISNGQYIGIQLDGGSIQWTTVNGAPAANVVTLTDVLTDDVAVDQKVWTYTTKITKPLQIVGVRRHTIADHTDTPLDRMSARQEYEDMPSKESDGSLSMAWYHRATPAGYLYCWPRPASPIAELIKFTWYRPIEDFSAVGDEADLPQEWVDTLIWNLADVLTGDYPVSPVRLTSIQNHAVLFLGQMAGVDREQESVFFQPDMSGYRVRTYTSR